MLAIEHIHPIIVHFPIVFMLSLAAFDVIAIARDAGIDGRGAIANVSTGLAVCAGVTAAVAFIFGDLAFDAALANGTPLAVLETHEELGKVTAALLLAWATIRGYLWWREVSFTQRGTRFLLAVELAGAALIITTAYFGGQLVYESGVGVSPQVSANTSTTLH